MSTLYIKRRFGKPHSKDDQIDSGNNFVFNFSDLDDDFQDNFKVDFKELEENFDAGGMFERTRPYEDVVVIPTFLQQIIKASFGKELRSVTVEPIQVTYTLNAAGGYTLEI